MINQLYSLGFEPAPDDKILGTVRVLHRLDSTVPRLLPQNLVDEYWGARNVSGRISSTTLERSKVVRSFKQSCSPTPVSGNSDEMYSESRLESVTNFLIRLIKEGDLEASVGRQLLAYYPSGLCRKNLEEAISRSKPDQ